MDNKSVNNLRAFALSPEDVMALTEKLNSCREDDRDYEIPEFSGFYLLDHIRDNNEEAIDYTYDEVEDVMDELAQLSFNYSEEISQLEECKEEIDKLISMYKGYVEMLDGCLEILDSEDYEEEDE